jgi:hypothetical protein
VLAKIEEHVSRGEPYLARRPERAGAVTLAPHLATTVRGSIDGARTSNGETLQAAAERSRAVRFHDEMNVVNLDREVDDPERAAAGSSQRAAQRREHHV